jgi:hypothetical protein
MLDCDGNTVMLTSLEKGRQIIEAKGSARAYFSYSIVTGTVMLNLF